MIEARTDAVVDDRCSEAVLELVEDVAVESGRSRRTVTIVEVDESSRVDARIER